MPSTDPSVRQSLDAIRRIVQALRLTAREAEKRVGLSAAQLFVLQKLGEAGRLTINELAARTHTHQSSVSVVVQRLARRNLVTRRRSDNDRRAVEAALTPTGRALLERAPQAAQERLVVALQALPLGQRKRLAALLTRVVRQTGLSSARPELFFESPQAKGNSKRHARNRARPTA